MCMYPLLRSSSSTYIPFCTVSFDALQPSFFITCIQTLQQPFCSLSVLSRYLCPSNLCGRSSDRIISLRKIPLRVDIAARIWQIILDPSARCGACNYFEILSVPLLQRSERSLRYQASGLIAQSANLLLIFAPSLHRNTVRYLQLTSTKLMPNDMESPEDPAARLKTVASLISFAQDLRHR
ncbi:hypothetical protein BDZ97DRAFT_510893 [Flammula alnicola]|nr:hypothetical protein BDZ97DRAFT_510893 [Flammula alnicola]